MLLPSWLPFCTCNPENEESCPKLATVLFQLEPPELVWVTKGYKVVPSEGIVLSVWYKVLFT